MYERIRESISAASSLFTESPANCSTILLASRSICVNSTNDRWRSCRTSILFSSSSKGTDPRYASSFSQMTVDSESSMHSSRVFVSRGALLIAIPSLPTVYNIIYVALHGGTVESNLLSRRCMKQSHTLDVHWAFSATDKPAPTSDDIYCV
jgi:hypothetical protein